MLLSSSTLDVGSTSSYDTCAPVGDHQIKEAISGNGSSVIVAIQDSDVLSALASHPQCWLTPQVKDLAAVAKAKFVAKTRAAQAAALAGWRELAAARRATLVRVNNLHARNVTLRLLLGWRCLLQVAAVRYENVTIDADWLLVLPNRNHSITNASQDRLSHSSAQRDGVCCSCSAAGLYRCLHLPFPCSDLT